MKSENRKRDISLNIMIKNREGFYSNVPKGLQDGGSGIKTVEFILLKSQKILFAKAKTS